jgi:redox-sensing transcriptional repressor
MGKRIRHIPHAVIKRLTRYLTEVQQLRKEGVEWIASHELATALGLTGSTVRQDLTYLDFSGIAKRGYATEGLQQALEAVLGADTEWRAVIVGAGNLGRALTLHEDFRRRGFAICGIFDADPAKVGKRVGALVVQPMSELPASVGRKKVDIGILAVPDAAAQSVADQLIASGVRGLLNLTLVHVVAPPRVQVVASRIAASLLELAHGIKAAARAAAG